MRGIIAAALLIVLSLSALAEDAPGEPPAKPAEMRSDQLDMLFARLREPGVDSGEVERQIWQLWAASDSPTATILLEQSTRAIDDGAPAEALAMLDRLIGAFPDFAEAWNKRATLYFMMKRYDSSLADIARTLDLEPRHFGALAGKGMILMRQKDYAGARAAYEEALAVNPNLEQVKDALKELDRLEQGI
ncbi:MAG: tetratricopeptide repeat protein [Aestuariivirga sp.]|uniref:tetratricopeptide repeat protein n=1 Tax=Aestuariivirga sp. TaxID=2650926 RepID=UPI0038D13DFF